MKTRQEMIYDFMVSLAGNGELFESWNSNFDTDAEYAEYVMDLAKELADEMLKGL
jgi:hypothetical protein